MSRKRHASQNHALSTSHKNLANYSKIQTSNKYLVRLLQNIGKISAQKELNDKSIESIAEKPNDSVEDDFESPDTKFDNTSLNDELKLDIAQASR